MSPNTRELCWLRKSPGWKWEPVRALTGKLCSLILLPHSPLDHFLSPSEKMLGWVSLWNEMKVLMLLFPTDRNFFTCRFLELLLTAVMSCIKSRFPHRGFCMELLDLGWPLGVQRQQHTTKLLYRPLHKLQP